MFASEIAFTEIMNYSKLECFILKPENSSVTPREVFIIIH